MRYIGLYETIYKWFSAVKKQEHFKGKCLSAGYFFRKKFWPCPRRKKVEWHTNAFLAVNVTFLVFYLSHFVSEKKDHKLITNGILEPK